MFAMFMTYVTVLTNEQCD